MTQEESWAKATLIGKEERADGTHLIYHAQSTDNAALNKLKEEIVEQTGAIYEGERDYNSNKGFALGNGISQERWDAIFAKAPTRAKALEN